MVTFTQDQKNLTVPSALGNFASNGSGGSGVTPAEVQEMINSSLTEYDETVQGYISDVDVDVEQNKEDIQDLSGTTSALTEGLNSLSGTVSSLEEGVATISGQTAQITAITGQIEAISGATEQNAQDIATLSATTSGISSDVDSLGTKVESLSGITSGISNDLSSLGTDVESLSGATSGIAVDLETLSAYTAGIQGSDSIVAEYTSNISSAINALGAEIESAYNSGKNIFLKGKNSENNGEVVLTFYKYELYADNPRYYFRGIASSNNNNSAITYNVYIQKDISTGNWAIGGTDSSHFAAVSTISQYTLPTASSSTLGGVKVGSGLTIDGNGVLSVSGGSSSGPVVVDLDALTQQERAALYQELWTVSGSANEEYMFYAKFDEIEANTPLFLQVQNFNPDDYGGSIFLCGASSIRHLSSVIITYRYVIVNDGSYEKDRGVYDISKSIASAQSLGEIRVGSGLTIDQDGILSVSGGSSEQNYVIVDALSAITSPVDGMYVYVNSGITNLGPYSAFSFDASDCTGGNFYFYDSNNDQHYFTITGDNPPMVDMGNWAIPEGDGVWRMYTGWRGKLYIKYDSQTDIYSIAIPYEGAYDLNISLNDSVPYTAATETIPFENKGYFARRIQGRWIRTEYHFDEMSEADAVQAHSDIVSLSGQGYTEIYWKNQDGNISKAGWWNIDWNDSQKIRMIGTPQGDKWYTAAIYNSGSVEEKGDIQVKTQVYKAQFSFTPSTSAWTSNIGDIAYNIYQSWDGEKIAYANVYFNEVDKKASMGNIMHFWRNSNDDMYYNFCFGFNFVDLDGVEWKTKWTYDNNSDPAYTLVSMTQVQ